MKTNISKMAAIIRLHRSPLYRRAPQGSIGNAGIQALVERVWVRNHSQDTPDLQAALNSLSWENRGYRYADVSERDQPHQYRFVSVR